MFTRAEVAQHNTDEDLWVIINQRVYDLSVWINFHPGGRDALIEMAGKGKEEEKVEANNSFDIRCHGIL